MTRRGALIATALVTGVLVESAKARQLRTTGKLLNLDDLKGKLSFPLTAYTEYRFSLDGETIVFTPAEVMAALKPCEHEPLETQWREPSTFQTIDDDKAAREIKGKLRTAPLEITANNDITIRFCRKCGMVYRVGKR